MAGTGSSMAGAMARSFLWNAGANGFGYDPIFQMAGLTQTMADYLIPRESHQSPRQGFAKHPPVIGAIDPDGKIGRNQWNRSMIAGHTSQENTFVTTPG